MAKTSDIQKIQKILEVTADSVWGPKSQTALNAVICRTIAGNPTLKRIQKVLGLEADGSWATKCQTVLNDKISACDGFSCTASSFADLEDVVSFIKCKATGKTDKQCFAVGDNGIGQFGKITAQEQIPMVAVHATAMTARWGSVAGAAHRPVTVSVGGKTVAATVEDRISAPGRIDLNPAAAKALGLKPPFLKPCVWKWA